MIPRHIDHERILSREETERRFGVSLARCPFCGSGGAGIYLGPTAHVTCRSCGADGPIVDEPSGRDNLEERQHKSVLLWNGRI